MKYRKQTYNKGTIMIPIMLFCLSVISVNTYLRADALEKITISVYGLKSIGVPQSLASSLQEHLESNILQYEQFDVMSRNNIDLILKESKFQQTGICSDEQCLIEAGHILGVEKIITGTISIVGSTYNVVLKMIDVETAKLESSVSRKHSGNIDTLLDIAEVSLKTLIGENQKYASERELQIKRERRENEYMEKIERLQRELEELEKRTAELHNNWEEEKNNVAMLEYLHKEQEKKIHELEDMQYAYELNKEPRLQSDVTVQVASNEGDNYTGNENKHAEKKNSAACGVSKKGKKIGIGAIIVLGVVGVSVLVFQLLGANQ